jgi:hypothetical protein
MTPFRLTKSGGAEILTDRVELLPNGPLSKRVRAGIGWNASSSLIGQLISFVRSIVLARLLAPDDFGLFSMALSIVLGLHALTTIVPALLLLLLRPDLRRWIAETAQ